VSTTHSEQAPLPGKDLYFPVGQAWHAAPFEPKYPDLQIQFAEDELSTADNVFDGQIAAVADPRMQYVPI